MRRNTFLALMFGLVVLACSAAQPAWATLGGSADSVESDQHALSAVRKATTSRNGYTVQEIQVGATLVREYVSSTGVVFAIAWNGLTNPNLEELLGSYAADYEKARQQMPRPRDRSRSEVRTHNVVVETWGHMRNLQGRAYAPELVPPGVSIDDLK
jgi:hypothetical protein